MIDLIIAQIEDFRFSSHQFLIIEFQYFGGFSQQIFPG